jgi:hypothetical protein
MSRSILILSQLLAAILSVNTLANKFVINEVVGDPQQDWNDSSGGEPFDNTPGIGVVTTSDEYIELKNVSLITQSLQGYRLLMADGSDTTDCFGFAAVSCTTSATYRVGPSGTLSAVPAGGYVVIGNPTGDILNNVSMTLSDSTSTFVDFVNSVVTRQISIQIPLSTRLSPALRTASTATLAPLTFPTAPRVSGPQILVETLTTTAPSMPPTTSCGARATERRAVSTHGGPISAQASEPVWMPSRIPQFRNQRRWCC